jgi:hypothetical protein
MSIKAKLDKLFEEWQDQAPELFQHDFYADGILAENEAEWNSAEIKVLFVLKEVHNAENQSCVCSFLESDDIQKGYEQSSLMWRKLMYWACCLVNDSAASSPNYRLEDMRDKTLYSQTLRKIAIMNLKKCEGGSTANGEKSRRNLTFDKHAELFSHLIKKEIDILNPDIIIACSSDVFKALKKIYQGPRSRKKLDTVTLTGKLKQYNYGRYFLLPAQEKPVYVIEYRHPAMDNLPTNDHSDSMMLIRRFIQGKQQQLT